MLVREIASSRKPFFLLKSGDVCYMMHGSLQRGRGGYFFDAAHILSPDGKKYGRWVGSTYCSEVVCDLTRSEFKLLLKIGVANKK